MAESFLRPGYFYCQNLVPNYSFEDYSTCPSGGSEIYKTFPWFQPNISNGNIINSSSSDCFNICSTSVPDNYAGSQFAKTGVGYAGFSPYTWQYSGYREYIEVGLINTLMNGKNYCIEFYLSLADGNKYATDAIGMYFSTDSVLDSSNYQYLPFIPQISNSTGNFLADKNEWMKISGMFTAAGGEKFITIGNFYDDMNTDTMFIGNGVNEAVYYYIDDVSVTLCDTTAVGELKIEDYRLQIYPNPANGNVTVTVTSGDKIIITDITGRKIKEYKISGNQLKINTDEYDNGIYFLSLYNNNSFIATEKMVILNE